MIPNLQNPENPLPYDPMKLPKTIGAGGGYTRTENPGIRLERAGAPLKMCARDL